MLDWNQRYEVTGVNSQFLTQLLSYTETYGWRRVLACARTCLFPACVHRRPRAVAPRGHARPPRTQVFDPKHPSPLKGDQGSLERWPSPGLRQGQNPTSPQRLLRSRKKGRAGISQGRRASPEGLPLAMLEVIWAPRHTRAVTHCNPAVPPDQTAWASPVPKRRAPRTSRQDALRSPGHGSGPFWSQMHRLGHSMRGPQTKGLSRHLHSRHCRGRPGKTGRVPWSQGLRRTGPGAAGLRGQWLAPLPVKELTEPLVKPSRSGAGAGQVESLSVLEVSGRFAKRTAGAQGGPAGSPGGQCVRGAMEMALVWEPA